jgi:chemotaxis protein methyltransferase CheR
MKLSAQDYAFVRRLVLDRAAIAIGSDQEYLVRSRLEAVAREAGMQDLSALVQRLRKCSTSALHTRVVEAMTTNETSFFRDRHPFEALRTTVLPELIAKKSKEKTLLIWSAACSTGQEPHSLAVLLTEHFPELHAWQLRIVGSDISGAALEKARAGRYSALEIGRGLPARMLTHYFDRVGPQFEVQSRLRSMIEWRQLNLAGRWPRLPTFDIVFLRNVLIYFPAQTSASVLRSVHGTLSPDGYLVLGSAEKVLGMSVGFEPVSIGKTTIYRPLRR